VLPVFVLKNQIVATRVWAWRFVTRAGGFFFISRRAYVIYFISQVVSKTSGEGWLAAKGEAKTASG
jgi:hypothetical protein